MKREVRRIIGESKSVKAMNTLIERVAPSKTNVLIIGESGTGKELVARMIHELGPLKGKPFVPVNCGAIPETLIESEMFGHKRGSFTGAVSDKPGLFEVADGGTLFLDEIGELPLSMQVKLLRALQERVIRRVGSNDDVKVDVRIIAATNRDLEAAIAKGTFREDLYYRLNVLLIKTPPLRERKGDAKILAEFFLDRLNQKQGRDLKGFEPVALEAIERYSWPGDVRELENVMERVVTLESGPKVSLASFPKAVLEAVFPSGSGAKAPPSAALQAGQLSVPAPDFSNGPLDLERVVADVERVYISAALEKSGGSKKKAAELLGITFRSFRYRLAKLGVENGPEGESGA